MHRLLVIGAAALAALAVSAPAGAWTWPADGAVLRPFSLGPDPYAGGQHRGVDIAGPEGSSVRAPATGTVTFAGSLSAHGRGVTIQTANGYAVTLVHLGTIGVEKGAAVTEGVVVGTVGWSGTPEHSVPSVHLGVRRANDSEGYVDPLALLPPRSAPTPPSAPAPATAPAPAPAPASAPAPAPVTPPSSSPPTTPAPVAAPSPPVVTPSTAPPPLPAPAAPPPAVEAGASAPGAVVPTASAPVAGRGGEPVVAAGDSPGISIVPNRPLAASTAPPRPAEPTGGSSARAHTTAPSPAADAREVGGRTRIGRRPTPAVPTAAYLGTIEEAVGPVRTAARAAPPAVLNDLALPPPSGIDPGARAQAAENAGSSIVPGGEPPAPAVPAHVSTARSAQASTAVPRPRVGGVGADHPRVPLGPVLAALALGGLIAAAVVRRGARRIGADGAVLHHDADLLRELDPAHRARLHDRGGGRLRTPPAAARS